MFRSEYGVWFNLYKVALLEFDMRKMPERLSLANKAIKERLRQLEGSSDHHEERYDIRAALDNLRVLDGMKDIENRTGGSPSRREHEPLHCREGA